MRAPSLRKKSIPARDRPEERRESPGELARFLVILALLAWALRAFVAAPFNIPSGSMLPTLYIGDYLVVAKWPYGYSQYSFPFNFPSFEGRILGRLPARGDVVVFRHPFEDSDLIKRVIGLPDDTVAVRGGQVVLNGKLLKRQPLAAARIPVTPNSPCKLISGAAQADSATCSYPAFRESLPGGPSYTVLDQIQGGPADDFAPVRVPADHVFLMGDNRDDSLDSRFPAYEGGIGMVPVDRLIGRASFTFWSTDGSASYVKPWTWFSALRASRIGNGYTGDAE